MPSHLEKDSVSSHTFPLRLGADRWLHMQFQELEGIAPPPQSSKEMLEIPLVGICGVILVPSMNPNRPSQSNRFEGTVRVTGSPWQK